MIRTHWPIAAFTRLDCDAPPSLHGYSPFRPVPKRQPGKAQDVKRDSASGRECRQDLPVGWVKLASRRAPPQCSSRRHASVYVQNCASGCSSRPARAAMIAPMRAVQRWRLRPAVEELDCIHGLPVTCLKRGSRCAALPACARRVAKKGASSAATAVDMPGRAVMRLTWLGSVLPSGAGRDRAAWKVNRVQSARRPHRQERAESLVSHSTTLAKHHHRYSYQRRSNQSGRLPCR